MANRIRVMPEDLANKIAAGEVVERPAAVVKELVENAIDAGSTRVSVEIRAGGKRLIRVIDNGCGMSREDALLAFDRHATSKIATEEDLSRIDTLGFRGEALPSIASVARVELVTNTADRVAGTSIRIEGGTVRQVEDAGRAPGTTVSVSHLFYNVPARRKFLRGADTEQRHVANALTAIALAYPEIAFSLDIDGREVITLPAVTNTHARARAVLGDTVVNQMIPVTFEDSFAQITGFIGRPEAARISRTTQYIFVNLRPVTSRLLNHAVYEAYGALLPKDRYPVTILYLSLDLDQVDVNVHPTKREVRFSNDSFVYERMLRAVRLALQSSDIIPEMHPEARMITSIGPVVSPATEETTGVVTVTGAASKKKAQIDLFTALNRAPQATGGWTYRPSSGKDAPVEQDGVTDEQGGDAASGMVSLWQLHHTYIFAQIKGGLVVIDQQAAHARVLYERALEAIRTSSGASQQLLFPITLDLTMPQFALVKEHFDLFNRLGFGLKLFGGQTVVIEAVPGLTRKGAEETILQHTIDELSNLSASHYKPEERLAIAFSGRAAISRGRPLAQEEMNALINDLFATSMPYVSPHGRPTVIRIPLEDLDRKFKRS